MLSEKRFLTFSRVTPEKGVDEAINAIVEANRKGTRCHLDVWGPIEQGYQKHYDSLFENFKKHVTYRGVLRQDEGLEKLVDYYMLLFPTYYPGEGFPTTICEAFMAGLPVIASNWRFNSEIITDGKSGFLFPVHDNMELIKLIVYATENEKEIIQMKKYVLNYSHLFEPQNAMKDLLAWIKKLRRE